MNYRDIEHIQSVRRIVENLDNPSRETDLAVTLIFNPTYHASTGRAHTIVSDEKYKRSAFYLAGGRSRLVRGITKSFADVIIAFNLESLEGIQILKNTSFNKPTIYACFLDDRFSGVGFNMACATVSALLSREVVNIREAENNE